MDRETFKLVMAIGVLLNSALYLTGVVVAGLVTHSAFSWRFGIIAAGLTYLSYVCHFGSNPDDRWGLACEGLAAPLVWASIAAGVLAGLGLL